MDNRTELYNRWWLFNKLIDTYLNSVEFYLPQKFEYNRNCLKHLTKNKSSKILEKVGINKRYLVDHKTTTIDLAIKSSSKLSVSQKNKIDYIIFCSQTPDYIIPSSSCIIQNRLKLKTNIGAIDLIQGCSGYNYSLSLAQSLIDSKQANNILILTSDTYTKFIDKGDLATRLIFSDAATCSIISNKINSKSFKILDHSRGTDGSESNAFILPKFGSKNFGSKSMRDHFIHMDGSKIFNFTIKTIPEFIKKFLDKNKISIKQVDHFIFHQASLFILNKLREKLEIPEYKFHINIKDIGNTVSSSIPISLKLNKKLFKKNQKILLVGFGVGLSWSSTLLEKV